ncbi:MAG: UDP-N-acetyl-D-glucosamine 2-epimerase, UDP-hydrolysing [Candidatus Portnoybacteria bacterium RBG_13_40_8]|uniref:UDP-N-acetyl-D-glucosamine 2-epimerase, UDP-hydrolysing n=1 Tax=Candidatus Portnoybacteria bacterium RBG_13_40_8 TaxID=1801990 RepID=A0A1G2F545_9BACT|nr:MAG: UDP-N-acetyl-D-glucosamine 2-epimerase, UDP-hydrolysing [Candidatus Portnoybacteria bacterium RBG_13_40_8]
MGKSKAKIRKICVVTGNRSEYSKLKPVMRAIKKNPKLKLILIVTASHLLDDFGKTINAIRDDGFKINAVARTIAAGEDLISMAKSVGLCALEIPTLLSLYKPDMVFVSGDRFDILGTVVSAAFMNIPIAHMEGGETTGSIDESIRHAITKLAHIHFPATAKSAERIIKMGERPDMVFNVGCSAVDIILSKKNKPRSEIYRKYNLDKNKPFLIVVQHPVTTEYQYCRQQIRETLKAISELKIKTIMLFPNVDAGSKDMVREIRLFDIAKKLGHVTMGKNIVFEDYISLLAKATCMVGNSSSGIRESCYFGTPTINIGTRQNGRERGKNVINVGYDKAEIKKAILKSIQHGKYPPEYIYGKGNTSKKIVNILSTIELDNIIQKKITI